MAKCAKCGETIGDDFAKCWKCGADMNASASTNAPLESTRPRRPTPKGFVERPISISVICLLGFIATPVVILFVFLKPMAIPLLLVFIPSAIALVGYWRMKKWGVYMYALLVIGGIAAGAQISLGGLIVVLIGLSNLKRMT